MFQLDLTLQLSIRVPDLKRIIRSLVSGLLK